jgi:hypothetical protein
VACRAASEANADGSTTTDAARAAASASGSFRGTKKEASAPTRSAFNTPRTRPNTCAGEAPTATQSSGSISPHDSNASAAASRFSSERGMARAGPTLPDEKKTAAVPLGQDRRRTSALRADRRGSGEEAE